MKIPFTKYHIVKEQDVKDLYCLKVLVSGFVPALEHLMVVIKAAKVGASAYGRRKKRRKVQRRLNELRVRMGLIETEAA